MSTETKIALAVALVLGATAAVAMINYDVNAPPAASTPQNNAAAVAATPMKRQFFEDNDRFIIDPSLSPFAKPQPRCSL
jgi:hypothetical protein